MSYTLKDFQHLLGIETERDLKGTTPVEVIKACGFQGDTWHGRFVLRLSDGRFAYLKGGICESDYFSYSGARLANSIDELSPLPVICADLDTETASGERRGDRGEVEYDDSDMLIEWEEYPADLNKWIRNGMPND